jgi:hypothetical protein
MHPKQSLALVGCFLLIAASFAVVASPQVAGASIYSCYAAGPGNYFGGYVGPVNAGQTGSAAVITNRLPQEYCSGHGGNFASAWSMIASGDAQGYAQAGYDSALCNGGVCGTYQNPHYFTQARQGAAFAPQTWVGPAVPVHSTDLYWAWMDTSCACARMAIGYITYIQTSLFNPFTQWNGTQTQWLNETSDPADHIFGASGSKVAWTTVQQLPYLGSWSGAVAPLTYVSQSPFIWNIGSVVNPCLNGYACWETWANP